MPLPSSIDSPLNIKKGPLGLLLRWCGLEEVAHRGEVTDLGARFARFVPQPQHLSALWLWATQVSSAAQTCPTLCNPMDGSTPGLPVHHNSWSFLRLMSIELVMPSNHLILCRPLLPPSLFPSIRVFSSESSSLHQVAKVLEFQLQHQSFQCIFRTDFL